MFNPKTQPSDSPDSRVNATDAERGRAPLAVTIFSDDPATARALLKACEFMPSFDCRTRVAAFGGEAAELRERPGELVIVDHANAADRQFDPNRFPSASCVFLVHDCAAVAVPPSLEARSLVYLHAADLSPTALQMAIRSAIRAAGQRQASAEGAEAIEHDLDVARNDRQRLLDEVAPIARALDGLLDIIASNEAATPHDLNSQHALFRNWARDLVGVVERHQQAIARAQGARADLRAILERAIPLFEEDCARRGQTVVLSSPAEPVIVAAQAQTLRRDILQLVQSVFEREGRDRRIDIVLWRSHHECRLAFVTGPAVRRHDEEETSRDSFQAVRAATSADARMMGALARLKRIGGFVESSSNSAFGASLLISLPTV